MREGIRQFLTFEKRLGGREPSRPRGHRREHEAQQSYFGALEALRAHLHRCLIQVAGIADVEVPKIAPHMRYDAAWTLDAYARSALSD
jgi:hypothetical protein